MPSILFINRVYPPAEGATGRVLEHVANGFVLAGWEVTVLTTAYPGEKAAATAPGGVRVIRCGSFFSKQNLFFRAIGYFLMIPSLALRALRLAPADVVVTLTDPPLLLLIGPILQLLKKSRLIHWAQDLYPEIAEQLGILRPGGRIALALRWVSTRAMLSHDLTVCVGRCMAERIAARGIPREFIRVVPNTGIEEEIVPVDHSLNPFRLRYGLENSFVIEYSGNMGRAHDFSTVLQSARSFQEIGERDILFLFVGSGPSEKLLREDVTRLGLSNVRFLPSQPQNQLSETLGIGDLHLVTMKEGVSGLVVPSKFYGIMAAERPTLFVGPDDSEVALIIRDYGVGVVVRPRDSEGLTAAILKCKNAPDKRISMGRNARLMLQQQDAIQLLIAEATATLASSKSP